MKYIKLAGVLCLGVFLIGCGKKVDTKDLTKVTIGHHTFEVARGEEVSQNYWNEDREASYYDAAGKEHRYEEQVVLMDGIHIGSSVEAVLEAYGVEPGDAIVDREIDSYKDGTTKGVKRAYENLDFFENEGVLDACFIFGYEQKDGEWTKLSYDYLYKMVYEDSKEKGEYLIFYFDFVGSSLAAEEDVEEKGLIGITICH